MRELTLSQNASLLSQTPLSTARAATATDGACQSAANLARFPHRRHDVAATWTAAKSWIGLAYPCMSLDGAQSELEAKLPAFAANIARLKVAAEAAASTYENEPEATMDAFMLALGRWEKATLDALTALDYAKEDARV